MITMKVNDVLSILALSPRGPWQALHPDLAGLYVFGSCTPRWAGAQWGIRALQAFREYVLIQKHVVWDLRFCFKPADRTFFRQLINWEGKTKRLRSIQGINEHPGFFFGCLPSVAAGLDFGPLWFWPAWRSFAGPFRCFLHWFQHHLGTYQQSSHLRKPVPGPFLVHANSYVKLLNNEFNERLCMVHAMGFLIYRVVLFWHQYNLFGAVRMSCGTAFGNAFFCFASI